MLLPKIARTTALLLAVLSAAGAPAATYQYRTYIPGLSATTPPLTPPAVSIVLALTGGALPDATKNRAYSVDLAATQLSVTGDKAYTSAQVSWSGGTGLPTGLTLNSDGTITGTPSVVGGPSAFDVTASYKGQSDQKTFSITVNDLVFKVSAVVAGTTHSCAITDTKSVKCWGSGWLGNGAGAMSAYTPVDVLGVADVAQLAAGPYHTCARTTGGQVYCWGQNNLGAVGDGTNTNRTSATLVSGLSSVIDISAAGIDSSISGNGNTTTEYTCAVTSGGATYCWGSNSFANVYSSSPSQLAGLTTSKSVGAGDYHICVGVGSASGQYGAKCIGYNVSYQLGRGAAYSVAGPSYTLDWVASLPTTAQVVQLRSGLAQSCALLSTGALYCWGDYYGNGVASLKTSATYITSNVTSIDVGRQISCAATSAGSAMCWGITTKGALGNGVASQTAYAPVTVSGGDLVSAVTVGERHGCLTTQGGTAKCWGDNSSGQVGDGTTTLRLVPTTVTP